MKKKKSDTSRNELRITALRKGRSNLETSEFERQPRKMCVEKLDRRLNLTLQLNTLSIFHPSLFIIQSNPATRYFRKFIEANDSSSPILLEPMTATTFHGPHPLLLTRQQVILYPLHQYHSTPSSQPYHAPSVSLSST